MPGPLDALEMMKQGLLVDAGEAMTEAQAYEQMFAEQIARNRRIGGRMEFSRKELAESLAAGTPMSQSAYAGLSPAQIVDTVAMATEKADEQAIADAMTGSKARALKADQDYANSMSERHGKKFLMDDLQGEPTDREKLNAERTHARPAQPAPYGYNAPKLGDISRDSEGKARYTPGQVAESPSERRYGRFEDARGVMGNQNFYQAMAEMGTDPFEFARRIAGQLTVQRQRATQPDPVYDQMLYDDLPMY